MGNTGAWHYVRTGMSHEGMTRAQLLKSSRYRVRMTTRNIGLRYELEFLHPDRGGSDALCPYRCGWKMPLRAKGLNRKFRRHQRQCPGIGRDDE